MIDRDLNAILRQRTNELGGVLGKLQDELAGGLNTPGAGELIELSATLVLGLTQLWFSVSKKNGLEAVDAALARIDRAMGKGPKVSG